MGHPKKNVVHVSGYYEDQKENISTQRRRANKAGPSTVPSPDLVNKIDTESSNMEADFVVAQNSKLQESTGRFFFTKDKGYRLGARILWESINLGP